MYAVGLLDKGEYAKLLSINEFNQYISDYGGFKDRIEKAMTLKEIIQDGWQIVHVESLRHAEP